jgi:hypothetical protein
LLLRVSIADDNRAGKMVPSGTCPDKPIEASRKNATTQPGFLAAIQPISTLGLTALTK